ncbi:MAG: cell division protein FtsA [Rhodobacteraceae bacterium]|nr:cell division protein FtsA [Paracoccaceae bacterium]
MTIDPIVQKRVMRANRREAWQRGVAAVVDLGTSKTSCAILEFEPGLPERAVENRNIPSALSSYKVIGYATTRSNGVSRGEIRDIGKQTDTLRLVLSKAQRMARKSVNHLFVCLSGGGPQPFHVFGDVRLRGDHVTERDIAEALYNCEVPDPGHGREFMHAHLINFAVDHQTGLHDPRGKAGNRVSVDMHLTSCNSRTMSNAVSCIEDCGLTVSGVASSAYVSGLSTLVAEEQETGSACIDIGAGVTNIVVFFKNHLVHVSTLNLGGDDITAEIENMFSIPKHEAERLKTVQGSVMNTNRDTRTYCEFRRGDNSVGRITCSELIRVIRPCVEEILDRVAASLNSAGFPDVPGNSIVLTGGCIDTLDLEELAKQMLGQQTRFGRPLRLRGLPQAMTGPQYSSLVGLCLHAVLPQDEYWDFPDVQTEIEKNVLDRTFRWMARNW